VVPDVHGRDHRPAPPVLRAAHDQGRARGAGHRAQRRRAPPQEAAAAAMADDQQVRIRRHVTKRVDERERGATPVSTNFDVPAGTETGASEIVVVANGIPSAPVSVTVS